MELQPGDNLRLALNGQVQTVTILGIVYPTEGDGEASQWLLMDISAAQDLTSMQDRLSRIDLILEPDQIEQLRNVLPDGVRLESASQQAQAVTQLWV